MLNRIYDGRLRLLRHADKSKEFLLLRSHGSTFWCGWGCQRLPDHVNQNLGHFLVNWSVLFWLRSVHYSGMARLRWHALVRLHWDPLLWLSLLDVSWRAEVEVEAFMLIVSARLSLLHLNLRGKAGITLVFRPSDLTSARPVWLKSHHFQLELVLLLWLHVLLHHCLHHHLLLLLLMRNNPILGLHLLARLH